MVPELTFRHSKMMEQMGLPVEGMTSRLYVFTCVSAFVAIVVGCGQDQADYLVDQHIMGGGSLESIYEAYVNAIKDSGFFKKLLNLDGQEKEDGQPKKKSSVKMAQKSSETDE